MVWVKNNVFLRGVYLTFYGHFYATCHSTFTFHMYIQEGKKADKPETTGKDRGLTFVSVKPQGLTVLCLLCQNQIFFDKTSGCFQMCSWWQKAKKWIFS